MKTLQKDLKEGDQFQYPGSSLVWTLHKLSHADLWILVGSNTNAENPFYATQWCAINSSFNQTPFGAFGGCFEMFTKL